MQKRPKYKDKILLDTGNIVYTYEKEDLAARKRKKITKTNRLKRTLDDLINKVTSDIKNRDPSVSEPALVVSIILCTYERVGNEASADNGHYGITGLERRHLLDRGDHIILKYVGKSAVSHNKPIFEPGVVRVLQKKIKSLRPSERVFNCTPLQVNSYLSEFGITSKDIRTFAANKFMRDELKTLSHGQNLDKKSSRHAIFNSALNTVAEMIGHKPTTLRTMYLHDSLKQQFLELGKA